MISDNGANKRGPLAKPSKKVVTPKVETSGETPKSRAMNVVPDV